MKALDTTPEAVLREAIQSEVETRVYYQKMAERAGSPAVKARMLQLADIELVHRAKMERKYRETIGSEPPEPAPVVIELDRDLVKLDMRQALKHSLERERESESHYRFQAERVASSSVLGRLFNELAEVEWKHKTDLQAEYDSVVTKDPESFLNDL